MKFLFGFPHRLSHELDIYLKVRKHLFDFKKVILFEGSTGAPDAFQGAHDWIFLFSLKFSCAYATFLTELTKVYVSKFNALLQNGPT